MINLTEAQKQKFREDDKKREEEMRITSLKSYKKEVQNRYNYAIQSIPPRFKGADRQDIPVEVYEKINLKGSVYLWGGCGVGKTHIGYALLKTRLDKLLEEANKKVADGKDGYYAFQRDIYFYNFPAMLQEIRNSINSEDKLSVKDYNYRMLILDDLGAEKFTDWSIEQLYELVNTRYEEMKPTIFISNLSLKELAEKVGDRIPSRIAEMCEVIKLEGNDKRLKNE